MNLDININRIMIRLSIMIFIIAVSIKLSAQVNNAISLIELKAIKDTTGYGEFDYKNRRYVWNNKKDWDLTDDFIKKPRKQQTNSLLEFLSSIDSLHILNYDMPPSAMPHLTMFYAHDTIPLFLLSVFPPLFQRWLLR